MNRNLFIFIRLGCFAAALLLTGRGQAQVTVSSTPPNGATGVSTSAPVVFTFSGPVDTNQTTATFFSTSPYAELPVISAWNSSSNQLTCTPSRGFPASQMIVWSVDGQDPDGGTVSGGGYFTTSTGSGSTGSGTNAITTFGVAKVNWWDQSSTAAPVVDPNIPYYFAGTTTLASNRTATSITLTLPTSAVSNLTQNLLYPEDYFFTSFFTSSNAFETAFPQGTYTFYVSATASNQTVPVLLPTDMKQPNSPHINNFAAAQSVNATQAFTLSWDSFVGGTSTDYVYVVIGTNVWKSPEPGAAGALNGTATSVAIPANSLQPNSTYSNSFVGFYHAIVKSNATYVTTAFRATATWFTLNTVGTVAAAPPVVTNAAWSGGSFSFDVLTTTGQTLTIVSSTNCALPLAQWPVFLTTNSPGARVHITDTGSATGRGMVYRVRNGT
ncbi:MAG: Ig-like domain-containing protein [Limisphaerales bacterium]